MSLVRFRNWALKTPVTTACAVIAGVFVFGMVHIMYGLIIVYTSSTSINSCSNPLPASDCVIPLSGIARYNGNFNLRVKKGGEYVIRAFLDAGNGIV